MARIRTIKPSMWTDAAFIRLSRDARLLLVGMISMADDSGRLMASAARLAGELYPADDVKLQQVRAWRDEVFASGIFVGYQVDGLEYAYAPQWTKHQKINRPQVSSLPEPPHSLNDSVNDSVNAHGSSGEGLTDDSLGEGKGREVPIGTSPHPQQRVPSNNAADVVAAFVDARQRHGLTVPDTDPKRVGRDARLMLDRGTANLGELVAAATDLGATEWADLGKQLNRRRTAAARQPGRAVETSGGWNV